MHIITEVQKTLLTCRSTPSTTLCLSLNTSSADIMRPPPSPPPPPPPQIIRKTTSQGFLAGPLMSFLSSSTIPPHYSKLDELEVCSRVPSPNALLPTSHKPSLTSPPSSPFIWQHPTPPSTIPSHFFTGMDVNQCPLTSVDPAEIGAEMSPPASAGMGRRTYGSSDFLINVMKRERERSSDADMERTCEVSSRGSDEEGAEGVIGSARKKLRLSKEQSALLEESFKEHSTLNPKQKAELAKQLNLRPRQVEVWFQNRRARTKLKQTEVDCELLKRCCESLTDENRRLQKEVQELRAMKVAPPCVIAHDLFMPLPAATLTICPSCECLASHTPAPAHTPPSSQLSCTKSPSRPSPLRPQLHLHHYPLSFPQPPAPPPQHALPSAAC